MAVLARSRFRSPLLARILIGEVTSGRLMQQRTVNVKSVLQCAKRFIARIVAARGACHHVSFFQEVTAEWRTFLKADLGFASIRPKEDKIHCVK